MKLKTIIVSAAFVIFIGTCSATALQLSHLQPDQTTRPTSSQTKPAREMSQKQPEPIGNFSIDFVRQYSAEKLTSANNDTVPCFWEQELLFDTAGCYELGTDGGHFSSASGFVTNLFERVVKIFPEPRLSVIGDYVYLVYDTENKTRLYLFFSKNKNSCFFADGFPVVMKEKLSYHDFTVLQKGDSIKKVESVDPVMPIYLKKFDEITESTIEQLTKNDDYLKSIHLLSDGILKIEYERTDGGYVVRSILYNEDFVLDGINGQTCYRINDADYIDAAE
jgi:hypothetical protein